MNRCINDITVLSEMLDSRLFKITTNLRLRNDRQTEFILNEVRLEHKPNLNNTQISLRKKVKNVYWKTDLQILKVVLNHVSRINNLEILGTEPHGTFNASKKW